MAGSTDTAEATKKLMENTRRSHEAVVGHAVALQQSNARFAQDVVEAFARKYRQQAEDGQAVAREFVERAEESRGDLQVLLQEPVEAYLDLLYAPLSYYKEALETFGEGRGERERAGGPEKSSVIV